MSNNARACRECPFRSGSGYVYDSDAIEALNSGMEPSCHAIVGTEAIFQDDPPNPSQRCRGHDRWVESVAGYEFPRELVDRLTIEGDKP